MVLEPRVSNRSSTPIPTATARDESALDAVGVCRKRCWKTDWVIDLDIQKFFDNVSMGPGRQGGSGQHTDLPWVVLYVQTVARKRRCSYPDGGLAVTETEEPHRARRSHRVLANLFLHYALDSWLARSFPVVQFERYCDDVVLHCFSQRQAKYIRHVVEERLLEFGLRCHPDKTRIVYCKQHGREEKYPVTDFTFLGFDFRRAPVRRRDGVLMCGFVPLVGKAALTSMARVIRQWRLGRRTSLSFRGLAAVINPIVSGWINYYGRFYKSKLMHFLEQQINPFLVKWAMRKYKRLRRAKRKTRRKLAEIASTFPGMFAHWKHGAMPTGSTVGAR